MVAARVLSERTGRLTAQLARYRGVRLLQDNVLWKPPGAKAIGFHQDASYADYLVPAEMITCWISSTICRLYSRYRRRGDLALDESFFPVTWDETGYRTPWLGDLPSL